MDAGHGGTEGDFARVMQTNRNWKAYADWTMNWALAHPTKVSYDEYRNTWCFSRPFYFYDSNGDYVKTRWTHVYLGETARKFITSMPRAERCGGTNQL
jgi:hypothetical protein